jgi:hypothetical protein
VVRDKAKTAEDKAKGRKTDLKSRFTSLSTLKKQAGLLSAKQDEMEIKSTGARNDYILNLASSNAHQERYYKHNLQVIIKRRFLTVLFFVFFRQMSQRLLHDSTQPKCLKCIENPDIERQSFTIKLRTK